MLYCNGILAELLFCVFTGLVRGLSVFSLLFLLVGCDDDKEEGSLIFGTSADYRPFEYYVDGEMVGFEIDLAKAVAKKLNMKPEFKDMAFSSVLIELQNGSIDVVVSSINPSEERRKNYDFTTVYHKSGIALIYRRSNNKMNISSDLAGMKIASQLGSVPEKWIRQNRPKVNIVSIDNVAQAVEFVKAGHVVGIVVDTTVAVSICADNKELKYAMMAEATDDEGGCAMAVKKGSPLKQQIDDVIQKMQDSGELQSIKGRWGIISE
ncbi:MAG: transporter substrate-binding domain-containing protein [Holosporales bacterium]|jgi:polar amino acid transport system substrate-binding protein|nr:transporter substrate-binding domain-containing protein [Holosporales bacterium]